MFLELELKVMKNVAFLTSHGQAFLTRLSFPI